MTDPGPAPPGAPTPQVPGPQAAHPVLRSLRDLLDLILPDTCASCGIPAHRLCPDCASAWWPCPRRVEEGAGRLDRMDGAGPLPVWALAAHRGPPRRAVLAWKDHGRAELTAWFAARTHAAAQDIAGPLSGLLRQPGRRTGRLVVSSAPPSRAGRRRRGEDLLHPLAASVAEGLTAAGLPARTGPALRVAGCRRDQVGLGARGRAANLAGRVRLGARGRETVRAGRVLLLDDVLTTGATLAACRAAVEGGGGSVVGALVLVVAPPPNTQPHWLEPGTDQG